MITALEPLANTTSYTAWDAVVILLREGLEAISVLVALLAYVKRTGNKLARKYIWTGLISGLLGSGLLALVLTYTLSQASSGNTRECIEGITRLVAVVMMIIVANWLHHKSNIANWNAYIHKQVEEALLTGNL